MKLMQMIRMMAAAMVLLLAVVAGAQSQPQLVPVFFTGLAGGDAPTGRRVLLRWDALDGVVDLSNAVIYRTNAANVRTKLAVVRPTRNPQLIQSIFYRPGEERIRQDAHEVLVRVYGTSGDNKQEFAHLAIDLLEGRDVSEYAGLRRNFLRQSNYGFAIVEGVGYLDFVNPAEGPFVYELWQGDAAGEPVDALGRITIDANTVVALPAPANLREVFLRGRDGATPARANHRRIYLNFDIPAELRAYRNTTFGYNIYKLPRPLVLGESFETVTAELSRMNKLPILEPSPIEGEQPDQSYIFVDDGEWLQTNADSDLLTVGDTNTYWAVARDLLGNEGLASDPLQATVRDTFEPTTPRGLSVFEDKGPDRVPFLHVQWNLQTEDTVGYRLYRYQEYGNAGKPGPFDPINGLTEGLIAELPLPVVPDLVKVSHHDFGANQAPRSTGFWYSVSAIDNSGNESALSPAAYGVIEDVVGPGPGRVTQFCVSRPVLNASVMVSTEGSSRDPSWTPRFVLVREHPAIVRARIVRVTIEPQKGGSTTEEVIHETEFDDTNVREFVYTDDQVGGANTIPFYRFEFDDAIGQSVDTTANPPATWTPGTERYLYRATAGVLRFTRNCDPFGTGELAPGPVTVFPGADVPPFDITIGCDGETVAWRLYRSVNGGQSYTLVREFNCNETPSVGVADDFHPDALTEVLYSLVPSDKHGNLGAPQYLDPVFVYNAKVPTPTLVSVDAVGLPATPSVRVRWIGPKSGVQYYRVMFEDQQNTQRRWLEFPSSSLAYDASQNQFEVTTSVIDRDNNPINPNANYVISVEAVTLATTSKASDQLPLTWGSKSLNAGPSGTFRWNARPVPPVVADDTLTVDFYSQHKGVLIRIVQTGGQEAGIPLAYRPRFPFMVWRQRTDKTGQPWVAVSPLLEGPNFAGEFLDDGFFRLEPVPFPDGPDRLFFLDSTGHVLGASYRYFFMEFDDTTGEINRLRGPLTTTILIPG